MNPNLLAAAILSTLRQDDGSASAPLGMVLAANEQSTFQQTHFSEALSAYAAGIPDSDGIEDLLNFVSPPIPVPRRFEFRRNVKGRFLAEDDDVRAIDGQFREITSYGKLESSRTLNKGLTYLIDTDRIPADVDAFEQSVVAWLWGMLLRMDLLRALNGLSQAATKVNVAWTGAKDPDADMLRELARSADVNGLERNRGLMGATMRMNRKLCYQAKDKSSALVARANMTDAELADYLELEELRKLSARMKSGTLYPPLYRNSGLFWNAVQSPIIDDPSHIKRCVSPCSNGAMRQVYREQRGPKIIAISVEHYSQHILPFTEGILQVIDANSATIPAPPSTEE